MEDNKRDYDDFFKNSSGNGSDQTNDRRESQASDPYREVARDERYERPEDEIRSSEDSRQAASPSDADRTFDTAPDAESQSPNYYAYGPSPSRETRSAVPSTRDDRVEMTRPAPVRAFESNPVRPFAPSGAKEKKSGKRSGIRSTFATILATAVVVGALMFGADRTNLFTGEQPALTSSGTASSVNGDSTSPSGKASTAALDIARPDNIAQIVQNSSPAVVKIETYVKPQSSRGGSSLFDDPFFREFFGGSPNSQGGQSDEPQQSGVGSGFIFEKDGYILTNQHVVEGADQIRVYVEGYEKPFTAELLGNSFDLDLAVLKITGDKDFPTLPLAADVSSTNVGDWVVAIGNPYGFDHTVTVGVLSAKERSIDIPEGTDTREYKNLIQTDASINPGNSGGPLLNLNGEVIGINTAINAEAQGIGFAVPITTIQEVLDNLKNNVEIPREPSPYIGIALDSIQQQYVSQLQLDNTDGALVGQVVMGSPAFKAGVKTYDVIVKYNGAAIKTPDELVEKVQANKVGDKVTLGIIRDGKAQDITVTIGDKNNVAEQQ